MPLQPGDRVRITGWSLTHEHMQPLVEIGRRARSLPGSTRRPWRCRPTSSNPLVPGHSGPTGSCYPENNAREPNPPIATLFCARWDGKGPSSLDPGKVMIQSTLTVVAPYTLPPASNCECCGKFTGCLHAVTRSLQENAVVSTPFPSQECGECSVLDDRQYWMIVCSGRFVAQQPDHPARRLTAPRRRSRWAPCQL
jgi:hypothetical protein